MTCGSGTIPRRYTPCSPSPAVCSVRVRVASCGCESTTAQSVRPAFSVRLIDVDRLFSSTSFFLSSSFFLSCNWSFAITSRESGLPLSLALSLSASLRLALELSPGRGRCRLATGHQRAALVPNSLLLCLPYFPSLPAARSSSLQVSQACSTCPCTKNTQGCSNPAICHLQGSADIFNQKVIGSL